MILHDINNPWCCSDCGKKYMKEWNWHIPEGVATFHRNTCGCCGVKKSVTHNRLYRWLHHWVLETEAYNKKQQTETDNNKTNEK